MHQKAFGGRALTKALWELTALPKHLSWIYGVGPRKEKQRRDRKEEGKGKEGRERREGREGEEKGKERRGMEGKGHPTFANRSPPFLRRLCTFDGLA